MRHNSSWITIFLLLLLCLIITSCHVQVPPELLLYGFESDEELKSINWKCHTLITLSSEHKTEGENSLRMELYPSNYPGLSLRLIKKDWSKFQALSFDIYNPESYQISLVLRIDDRMDSPEYGDRFNRRFSLRPGMNHVSLPLSNLISFQTQRKLNLQKIYRLSLSVPRPETKIVLFIDYIRLRGFMTPDNVTVISRMQE